jgi:hypothetical protein
MRTIARGVRPLPILLSLATTAWSGPEPAATGPLQVRVKSPMAARALAEAGEAALGRLAEPGCARIFSEFKGADGRTLQERLETLGRDGAAQLQTVRFYDGSARDACQRGRVLAVTEPGSLAVHVCPRFVLTQRQDPTHAPELLIHELLHTLGLGENPPSSEEISRHVRTRCGH